jgi:hypothetical protein
MSLTCPSGSDDKPINREPDGPSFPPGRPKFAAGGEALRLEDGKKFRLPKKAASKEGMTPEQLDQWLNQTKVNLVIDYRKETDRWELKQRNVKFAELIDIPLETSWEWNTLSASELQARFAKLDWKKATLAEMEQKETGFKSLMLTDGTRPPMTFAFETSDGHRGILQLFGSLHSSTGQSLVHFRYKHLQRADASVGVGKNVPESNWTFGPTLPRELLCLSSDPCPPGFEALRLEDGKSFSLPKKAASDKEGMTLEQLGKWFDEMKVNLAVDYREETGQWELKLRNVKLAELADIPSDSPRPPGGPRSGRGERPFLNSAWNMLSASELQARFSKLEWKKPTSVDKETGFQSLMLTQGMMSPMTFAYETSDGHRGILQFYANSSMIGSTIHYKQLEQADKMPESNWKYGRPLEQLFESG